MSAYRSGEDCPSDDIPSSLFPAFSLPADRTTPVNVRRLYSLDIYATRTNTDQTTLSCIRAMSSYSFLDVHFFCGIIMDGPFILFDFRKISTQDTFIGTATIWRPTQKHECGRTTSREAMRVSHYASISVYRMHVFVDSGAHFHSDTTYNQHNILGGPMVWFSRNTTLVLSPFSSVLSWVLQFREEGASGAEIGIGVDGLVKQYVCCGLYMLYLCIYQVQMFSMHTPSTALFPIFSSCYLCSRFNF